jgi:hypothetical protein
MVAFAKASATAVAMVGPILNQDVESSKKLCELKLQLTNYVSKTNSEDYQKCIDFADWFYACRQ